MRESERAFLTFPDTVLRTSYNISASAVLVPVRECSVRLICRPDAGQRPLPETCPFPPSAPGISQSLIIGSTAKYLPSPFRQWLLVSFPPPGPMELWSSSYAYHPWMGHWLHPVKLTLLRSSLPGLILSSTFLL